LPELSRLNQQLIEDEDYKSVIKNMLNVLSQIMFYTSKSNTGTGYDPATRADNNYPGQYIDNIYSILSPYI
jgi:hypothetical protein